MLSYSRDSPHLVETEAALPFVQHAATCFCPEHNNPVQFLAHSFFDMILNFFIYDYSFRMVSFLQDSSEKLYTYLCYISCVTQTRQPHGR